MKISLIKKGINLNLNITNGYPIDSILEDLFKIKMISEVGRGRSWPTPIKGSISHTEKLSKRHKQKSEISIIAWTSEEKIQSLGIDIEFSFLSPTYEEVNQLIATQKEYQILEPLPLTREEKGTILFCAKEATYKLLNPVVNQYFDFLDIELTSASYLHLQKGEYKLQFKTSFKNQYDLIDVYCYQNFFVDQMFFAMAIL